MNAKHLQESPQVQIGSGSMENWKDRLGIFASAACAVHCAATPILLATLPALKFTEFMASPLFHQIAAAICCGIVAIAIWPAFLRFRDYRVLSLSSLGLGLILSAAFVLPDQCCSHELSGVQTVALPQAQGTASCCSSSECSKDAHTLANEAKVHSHSHEHSHDHSHEGHAHHDHQEEVAAGASMHLAGIGAIQPWMTPLGGFLLIAAHGLNLRRRTCQSSGCTNPAC